MKRLMKMSLRKFNLFMNQYGFKLQLPDNM
jgi:hypothetical protein